MEDKNIIDLFLNRDEKSILETQSKYGNYLETISFNVLKDVEDSKECINDALLKAWNSIPPTIPENLKAYLAKIVRNLSLDLYAKKNAKKRGNGQVELCIDELSECIGKTLDSDKGVAKTAEIYKDGMQGYISSMNLNPESKMLEKELSNSINAFLEGLDEKKRIIFMRRYFYIDSIETIAKDMLISKSNVKTTLWRIRNSLYEYLKKENLVE